MKILHIFSCNAEREAFRRISGYLPATMEHSTLDIAGEISMAEKPDIVHAHSWFGSGSAAEALSEKFNIPYIVSVAHNDIKKYRNTVFFKKKAVCSALLQASKVVFTNNFDHDSLAVNLNSELADNVFDHSVVLLEPAGDYWTANLRMHPPTALVNIRLLYVGEIGEDSRLSTILDAMTILRKRNYNVTLTAVETIRAESSFRSKMKTTASKRDDFEFVELPQGDIMTDGRLMSFYRANDISVLLNTETDTIRHFAESATQGLPVIHAVESPFSGIFSEKMTDFSVNPNSPSELAARILQIGDNFATVEQHLSNLSPFIMFNPVETARKYEHMYDNVLIKHSAL
ncbi:MAG: hypothetical protein SPL42_00420 [Bacteroidales bacterium]|nr:hypothetical protein [Bacteroidales bacterium]